mmetsp:Transcript_13813/g.32129  ORF Transcript_13813/g.32129 Transcript_13813/m.32129 type:complete len:154 (-) Transcript_13813:60-521(-)
MMNKAPRMMSFHGGTQRLTQAIRAFTTSDTTMQPEKVEYVHPLSQLVLEHLQTTHRDWIVRNQLEKGLKFHDDGTFLLSFPQQGRIWTSFDSQEKKHWLTVHKGSLVGRFMLQDNQKPAWNDGRSTPQRIQDAVDAMIAQIDKNENEASGTKS